MAACLATAYAQGLNGIIENYYPSQLDPGQTTTVSIAINAGRGNPIQSVEVTPAEGVTVGAPKAEEPREGVVWWAVPITVAKDAAPGKRTLVAVQQNGRTKGVDVIVPDHTLAISNLKVTSAMTNAKTVDVQFRATEQGKATLGDSAMAYFTLSCGKVPEVGMVKGKAANGMVTASIPNPKTIAGAAAPSFSPKCDLEVRAADAAKVESNTLKTTVEFK